MGAVIFKTRIRKLEILGDVVLDYYVQINHLKEDDRVYYWGATGTNFSLAGLEIHLHRHKMAYILEYYVTSGLFVIVSWVSLY